MQNGVFCKPELTTLASGIIRYTSTYSCSLILLAGRSFFMPSVFPKNEPDRKLTYAQLVFLGITSRYLLFCVLLFCSCT